MRWRSDVGCGHAAGWNLRRRTSPCRTANLRPRRLTRRVPWSVAARLHCRILPSFMQDLRPPARPPLSHLCALCLPNPLVHARARSGFGYACARVCVYTCVQGVLALLRGSSRWLLWCARSQCGHDACAAHRGGDKPYEQLRERGVPLSGRALDRSLSAHQSLARPRGQPSGVLGRGRSGEVNVRATRSSVSG